MGEKYPQTNLLTAVLEPLGVLMNALVTFPIYVLSIKSGHSDNSITNHHAERIPIWRPQTGNYII
jgi:hypothetical protein